MIEDFPDKRLEELDSDTQQELLQELREEKELFRESIEILTLMVSLWDQIEHNEVTIKAAMRELLMYIEEHGDPLSELL